MILKRLKQSENLLTRPLWERVFDEDTQAFVEYYYTEKIKDNDIYVIETDGAIRSMIHLNPYVLHVGPREVAGRYIVGVATDILCRGQGYMTELLKKSMRDMYTAHLPFTFLMPADEKIYYPHHFRFIYAAEQWRISLCPDDETEQEIHAELLLTNAMKASERAGNKIELRRAEKVDCKRMSEFAEYLLRDTCQVYAKRDRRYYERLLEEQISQKGGIMIAEEDDSIKGMFIYDDEAGFSVREPMTAPGYESVFEELGIRFEKQPKKKPIIMARLLHIETLLSCMVCWEEMNVKFWLVDPLIQENNKLFMIKGNCEHLVVRTKPAVKPEDDVQLISISALASILFGYKSLEAIEKEEQETFSDEFKCEMRKLVPLQNVFLNEIV